LCLFAAKIWTRWHVEEDVDLGRRMEDQ
jgi:hypothetical protein